MIDWNDENKKKLLSCGTDVNAMMKMFPEGNRLSLKRRASEFRHHVIGSSADIEVEKDMLKHQYESSKKIVNDKYKTLLDRIDGLIVERDTAIALSSTKQGIVIEPRFGESKSESTAVIVASDWHYENIINANTVNSLNEFNPTIADSRIKKFFQNSTRMVRLFQNDTDISNIILELLGDFISGNIHEELLETAAMRPMEAIIKVTEYLIGGINFLLENTKCNLKIVCHSGNHCIKYDTEVLTQDGWKEAIDINLDDIIASFDISTGDTTFDKVKDIEHLREGGYYELISTHKNEVVTAKHNLVIDNELVPAENAMIRNLNNGNMRIASKIHSIGLPYTDDELRLLTWVIMDGTIVDCSKYDGANSIKKRIQFKLSRERKIKTLCQLLDTMKIPYTLKPTTMSAHNILQPYYIRIYSDWARKIWEMLDGNKQFPSDFINLNDKQIRIIIDTIGITDGTHRKNFIEWSSINKNNVDIIQTACILNNIPCRYKTKIGIIGGFKGRNTLYTTSIYPTGIGTALFDKIKIIKHPEEELFVGLMSKNGTIITRRNGIVNFTGNSRITKRTHIATEAGNSLEFLMYHNLKLHFANDKRVEFLISDGYHSYVEVYGRTIRSQHGHQVKFGGGIGGLAIPLMKATQAWNKGKSADLDIVAHFHQQRDFGYILTNGSLCGYDSFSLSIKADYEEPKQTFALLHKKHFKTVVAPIWLG